MRRWGNRSSNVQISTNVDRSTNAQFSTSAPILASTYVKSVSVLLDLGYKNNKNGTQKRKEIICRYGYS